MNRPVWAKILTLAPCPCNNKRRCPLMFRFDRYTLGRPYGVLRVGVLRKPIMPGAELTADQHDWQICRPMSTFAHGWNLKKATPAFLIPIAENRGFVHVAQHDRSFSHGCSHLSQVPHARSNALQLAINFTRSHSSLVDERHMLSNKAR